MANLVFLAFHHSNDSRQRSRQSGIAVHFERRDDHRSGLVCSLDSFFEGTPILRIQGSQTEIDHLYVMLEAPIDSPDDHTQAGGQFAVEDLDRNQIRIRIQVVDDRRDSRTMTKVIFIAGNRSVRRYGDSIDDLADVGMRAANATIQHRDAHWLAHTNDSRQTF
jgi:hypothetical protein